jgi:mitochondrial-processing peptidase subunit alpha
MLYYPSHLHVGSPGVSSSSSSSSLTFVAKRGLSSSSSSVSSSSSSFSSYEYPTRSEAPIVTATTAKEANRRLETERRTPSPTPITTSDDNDPFDDSCRLTDEQVQLERQKQKQWLEQEQLTLNTFPIGKEAPPFIPPNVSSQELEAPQTLISTLPNGVRVVSQETYGQMCTVGVLTNVGSRHEPQVGMMHLLETLAFSSTMNYPDHINALLQDWGATRFVSISREQTLHCIDVLRPNVEHAMALIADVLLEPNLDEAEIEHCKAVLRIQAQEAIPELALGEALQMAAYGPDQQLGRLHFATLDAVEELEPKKVVEFYQSTIRHNPKGMVVAGAGIGHHELVQLATKYFGPVTEHSHVTPIVTIPSVYRGGSHLIQNNHSSDSSDSSSSSGDESSSPIITPPDEYCRVALAFPLGGWHSDTMVTACVLQTLLGGGSSFSAGGPGKGMYSRMYQNVLNRYGWMETAEAFTSFADEGGLFGVSGSTAVPTKVVDLVTILADQMARLAVQPVTDVELTRARNMLKCNVLSQLESRLILFEDMGRQVLTYGAREDSQTTCRKIDAVTVQDIQSLAQQMLQSPPTLAATGAHLENVPSYAEVSQWFQHS